MTFFWIATVVLAFAMAGLLVLALIRGQRNTGPAEAFDVQVYRDQLNEVDRGGAARGDFGRKTRSGCGPKFRGVS